MSFSSTMKEELVKVRLRTRAAKIAQLAGITHTAGTLRLGRTLGLEYVTETLALGKHIASLATSLYGVQASLAVHRPENRRMSLTSVRLEGAQCETLLCDTGVIRRTGAGVELIEAFPEQLIVDEQTRRACLRGVFLGSGSISNPRRAYHLEIVCRSEVFAARLCKLIETCNAKNMARNGKHVVYLKEGDRIMAFVALIGASAAALAFEDVRAEKELRNYINRTSNCTTANIGKTVNAAADQLQAIHTIMRYMELEQLPPALCDAAKLRLMNPEASLQELAELAGMGKSGIYHRFRKLIDFAQELETGSTKTPHRR